jgi:hypothetical protein
LGWAAVEGEKKKKKPSKFQHCTDVRARKREDLSIPKRAKREREKYYDD